MTLVLAVTFLALAVLYSAVGHAGASGYLAALAILSDYPQEQFKAIALTLNIFVGGIGTWKFLRAGHFKWDCFWPFALCAIPMAFLGGLWQLPEIIFRPLIGLVLLFAAVMLVLKARGLFRQKSDPRMPALPVSMVCGGLLGLLAGLTGTGGGIFLSPLLILAGWAEPRTTAAVSIVFVLLNSLAGLGGVIVESPGLPGQLYIFIIAACLGGLVGSHLGSRRLPGNGIRYLLAIVLVVASTKMFMAPFDA